MKTNLKFNLLKVILAIIVVTIVFPIVSTQPIDAQSNVYQFLQSFSSTQGQNQRYYQMDSIAFSAATYSVNENGGSATITATLSAALSMTVTMNYTTNDGTATAGNDYAATSGALTFSPGQTSKTFSAPIIDDAQSENDKTFTVTLNNPANATLGTPTTATVTIMDDDMDRYVYLPLVVNSPLSISSGIPLSQVASTMGIQKIIYGVDGNSEYKEDNLNVTNPLSGVYVIKAKSSPCTINTPFPPPNGPICEPDRYEIRYSGQIANVYGLGIQALANQVKVNDFLDSSFSSGHVLTPPTIDNFDSDVGRMRTPVFVLPEKNTIIAYLQPEVKKLRLTRDGAYGCPANSTCFVLKKHETYPENTLAELVLVKGSSIEDAYTKYYNYLRSRSDLYFKRPIRQAFGVSWETYDEYGCKATAADIISAVNRYGAPLPLHPDLHINLSSLVIGSGYWEGWATGCSDFPTIPDGPGTESLRVNAGRYGNKAQFQTLFDNIINDPETGPTYPMIGMRHQVISSTKVTGNEKRIVDLFKKKITNPSPPWWPGYNNYSPNKGVTYTVKMLDTNNSAVMTAWVNLMREDTQYNGVLYGYTNNVKGIKEDDNGMTDQWGLGPNWSDDRVSKSYKWYNQYYNGDFLIFGRNDWFGVGTDGQNTQGWLGNGSPPSPFNGYRVKYYLDSALTQVVSGYPHPNSVLSGLFGNSGTNITNDKAKEFLRTNQLVTFFGVTTVSRGFWHLTTNQSYQEAVVFYNRLRNRLQQYAYDHAIKWYETGVPWLIQPLFIRWPNDPNSHSLYGVPAQANSPTDEFMFGNALLIRPVLTNDNSVSVYLPAGKWKRFMQKNSSAITGGATIVYTLATDSGDANDYPIFLKEGEILIIGDNTNPGELWAYVFLETDGSNSSEYSFHKSNGTIVKLQATRSAGNSVTLKRLDTGATITMGNDQYGKGFKIARLADLGVSY